MGRDDVSDWTAIHGEQQRTESTDPWGTPTSRVVSEDRCCPSFLDCSSNFYTRNQVVTEIKPKKPHKKWFYVLLVVDTLSHVIYNDSVYIAGLLRIRGGALHLGKHPMTSEVNNR